MPSHASDYSRGRQNEEEGTSSRRVTGHIDARSWLPAVSEARGSRGGHADAAARQVSYDTVIASGTRRGLERDTRLQGDVSEPAVV